MAGTMKSLDRMTKPELRALVDQRTEQLAALQAKVGGSTSSNLLRPTDVQGMSVSEVIMRCLEQRMLVTWKAAALVVNGQEGFFPSMIEKITGKFDGVLDGASALIVSGGGKHAAKVADQHASWLREHGFDKTPAVKSKSKNRSGGGVAGQVVCIDGKYYKVVG